MFRVEKNYEQIQKTLRLPCPLAEEIERISKENKISFNSLVVQCIEYALNNLEEKQVEEAK